MIRWRTKDGEKEEEEETRNSSLETRCIISGALIKLGFRSEIKYEDNNMI